MAVINNVAYSWSMVRVSIPALNLSEDSTVLQGCSAISWDKKRKVESNYGIGGEPQSRGFGNMTYEAKITLNYESQVQLRNLSEDGTLMGLGEFDLIVSWANSYAGTDWVTETVTLEGCLFAEEGMDTKQDDTNITKEFDLIPFRITPASA